MAKLTLHNNTFIRCGTAVKTRGQVDIDARANKLIDTKRGFDVEDEPGDDSKKGGSVAALGVAVTIGCGLAIEAISGVFSRLVAAVL